MPGLARCFGCRTMVSKIRCETLRGGLGLEAAQPPQHSWGSGQHRDQQQPELHTGSPYGIPVQHTLETKE